MRVAVWLQGCKPLCAGLAYSLHACFVCDSKRPAAAVRGLWCCICVGRLPFQYGFNTCSFCFCWRKNRTLSHFNMWFKLHVFSTRDLNYRLREMFFLMCSMLCGTLFLHLSSEATYCLYSNLDYKHSCSVGPVSTTHNRLSPAPRKLWPYGSLLLLSK